LGTDTFHGYDEEVWRYVKSEEARIVRLHERTLWVTFATPLIDRTLHLAERSLAPGEPSRIQTALAAG
jgi:hypothetical protein